MKPIKLKQSISIPSKYGVSISLYLTQDDGKHLVNRQKRWNCAKRLPGTVIKARFISTSEKFIALKVDPP